MTQKKEQIIKKATSKTQGTKDGKKLLNFKPQWIDYIGYRDNYESNLKTVLDDDKETPKNRTKAEELLKKLDDKYKLDAVKDIPDPTTTTDLKQQPKQQI